MILGREIWLNHINSEKGLLTLVTNMRLSKHMVIFRE